MKTVISGALTGLIIALTVNYFSKDDIQTVKSEKRAYIKETNFDSIYITNNRKIEYVYNKVDSLSKIK